MVRRYKSRRSSRTRHRSTRRRGGAKKNNAKNNNYNVMATNNSKNKPTPLIDMLLHYNKYPHASQHLMMYLKDHPEAIHEHDNTGRTPLMVAAMGGHAYPLEYILKMHPDPVSAVFETDNLGLSAIEYVDKAFEEDKISDVGRDSMHATLYQFRK